jgi:hypothetical protein
LAVVGCSSSAASSAVDAGDASFGDAPAEDAPPGDAPTDRATDATPDVADGEAADGTSDGEAADGGADVDSGDCMVYTGSCTESLDASACPKTRAAAVAECDGDGGPFSKPAAFASCSGLDAVIYDIDTASTLCLYDNAGLLVGAQGEADINDFCNQTDYLITAGTVPCECRYPWLRGIQAGMVDAGSCRSLDAGSD